MEKIRTLKRLKQSTSKTRQRIVGIYPGRFQPFHLNHYKTYKYLVKKFGIKDTFIVTSNKVQKGKSPFNFKQKQTIISKLYNISPKNILRIDGTPYRGDLIGKYFNQNPILVYVVTGKDADRLSGGKYFKGWFDDFEDDQLVCLNDGAYLYKTPLMTNKINGQLVSGSSVRSLISSKQFTTQQKHKIFKMIFGKFDKGIFDLMIEKITGKVIQGIESLLKDIKNLTKLNNKTTRRLLRQGGASGHMMHPFDDNELTFNDFKTMINRSLYGKLDIQGQATIKYDGQNIQISYKNGKLIAARNKGHLKNFGQNALDSKQLASAFKGRGNIQDAFNFAISDLEKAFDSLGLNKVSQIFQNGKKWIALQIIFSKTKNVIPYDRDMLIFHNISTVDQKGQKIDVDTKQAKQVYNALKKVNSDVQYHFTIQPQTIVKIPRVQNFADRRKYFIGKLNRLQSKYKLKGTDTLGDYNDAFWKEFIQKQAKSNNYIITKEVLNGLITRWSQGQKGKYTIHNFRAGCQNQDFVKWGNSFDKNNHSTYVKKNSQEWQQLFLQLGAQILKNLGQYISVNPDNYIQRVRKQIQQIEKQVRQSNDLSVITKFETQIKKLESLGGLDAIIPLQGIVFDFKGKTYKATGSFAPLNQILGLLKYAK